MVTQSYDATVNALYLSFSEPCGPVARTVAIDDGTNVDLEADGKVLGIEVLNPARPWPLVRILREYPDISEEDATGIIQAYGLPRSVGVA